MKKFKLNSNKTIVNLNREVVFPELGHKEAYQNIRSISFRPKDLEKLEKLRAKYKLSKSAIIRILLDDLDV